MEQNTEHTTQVPQNQPRRNTVSSQEQQQMQRGYPVRPDADPTIQRQINRATGPREVPETLKNGKMPVRQNANTGRTYPVMHRGDSTHPVEHRTKAVSQPEHTSQVPIASKPMNDPLAETQTFTKIPSKVQPTPRAHIPEPNEKHVKLSPLPRMPYLAIGIVCIILIIGLAVGIPMALSHGNSNTPDYDMTKDYLATTEPDTETDASETAGVGRDEATDTTEPETEPEVKFAVTLTFFDRDPITVSTTATTLRDLLTVIDYTILDTDNFSLPLDTELTEETTIAVDTVTYDTATETVTLPYESKVTNVQTIPKGQKNISQNGKNGSKTITYSVKLVNGVETERTVASEDVTAWPVDEIAEVGVGGTLVGSDGVTYSYSYYRMVNATYYDIPGATYLGYDANETVVATDFDYIPAGTKIYVKNDRYDFGVRTAADTGSSIDGWEVDVWLSDSNPQKATFAKEGYISDMIIYYLD